jgi:hypothetical protein
MEFPLSAAFDCGRYRCPDSSLQERLARPPKLRCLRPGSQILVFTLLLGLLLPGLRQKVRDGCETRQVKSGFPVEFLFQALSFGGIVEPAGKPLLTAGLSGIG